MKRYFGGKTLTIPETVFKIDVEDLAAEFILFTIPDLEGILRVISLPGYRYARLLSHKGKRLVSSVYLAHALG